MKTLRALLVLTLVASAALLGWLAAGGFDFAADAPHAHAVESLIAWARDRYVHTRAAELAVPALDDPLMLALGAGHYAEMCEGCHQSPGKQADEFIQGLYPAPPNLSEVRRAPAEQFWIIKHGIKGSAMPAWGLSHRDEVIWAMVAFVQKLPELTPAQYQAAVHPSSELPAHEHGVH